MIDGIQRILFVELLGGIGDLLIALPAIHAVARSYPSAQLTVLTFAPGSELLQADPLIHSVICAEKGQARQAVKTFLGQESFDLIISDTTYDGISDVIQHSTAKQTVTNLWKSPPANELVSDRFLRILEEENIIDSNFISSNHPQIYLTATERIKARQFFGATYRPLIFLIPDAGMRIKCWSIKNFIAVGKALRKQFNATIVVPEASTPGLAETLVHQIGDTAQVIQRGTLRDLAALLSEADLAIAPDTGPARIAATLNVPTITLFGPSWHGRYGQSAPHINLQGFTKCPKRVIQNFTEQCCWYSGQCPYEWETCVDEISPKVVLEAAGKLLEQRIERQEQPLELSVSSNNQSRLTVPIDKTVASPKILDKDFAVVNGLLHNQSPSIKRSLSASPTPDREHFRQIKDQSSTDYSASKEGILENDVFTKNFNTPILEADRIPKGDPHEVSRLHPEWRSLRNLLVMRLDNIGDVMMTSPALQALKENLPQAKITLMASPAGSLTASLMPGVDEVLPWRVLWQDLGRLAFDPEREWQLIETLKERQFDAAIIFTSFAQSPHPPALICALAGIPLRLGESKEQELGTLTHAVSPAPDDIHQVERNLCLIESVGFQIRDRRLSLKQPTADFVFPEPYILLNPWTSCQSRNYAATRFATAARTLSEITGWFVIVTGVEKDREQAQPLLEILGGCAIDLIGKTSLEELVSLVAKAKLVLTNNTSTMHIADAMRTPNLVMFAGTEKECQWRPRHSPSRLLRRPTVCSPCYAFTCPYELQCLDISPDVVVREALSLLEHV